VRPGIDIDEHIDRSLEGYYWYSSIHYLLIKTVSEEYSSQGLWLQTIQSLGRMEEDA
jgi:hypothetical protein